MSVLWCQTTTKAATPRRPSNQAERDSRLSDPGLLGCANEGSIQSRSEAQDALELSYTAGFSVMSGEFSERGAYPWECGIRAAKPLLSQPKTIVRDIVEEEPSQEGGRTRRVASRSAEAIEDYQNKPYKTSDW
jgi:hypothetical protein